MDVEECFIAAAGFLTSLQMSMSMLRFQHPLCCGVNLTLEQPVRNAGEPFMWAGSQIPNVWEEEQLQISPGSCNMWSSNCDL